MRWSWALIVSIVAVPAVAHAEPPALGPRVVKAEPNLAGPWGPADPDGAAGDRLARALAGTMGATLGYGGVVLAAVGVPMTVAGAVAVERAEGAPAWPIALTTAGAVTTALGIAGMVTGFSILAAVDDTPMVVTLAPGGARMALRF